MVKIQNKSKFIFRVILFYKGLGLKPPYVTGPKKSISLAFGIIGWQEKDWIQRGSAKLEPPRSQKEGSMLVDILR